VFLQVENRRDGYLGFALARLGRFDEAAALAGRLSADPASQMLVFAGLRDRERAFEALSRLLTANPWRAATWMTRPEMDLLRGDDRYAQYRLRLGLSCEIVGRGGRPVTEPA
jgi:hypothetical protein